MKLYAIKLLATDNFSDADEPFVGIEPMVFDTPGGAIDYMLNTSIPTAKKIARESYSKGYSEDEDDITFEVESCEEYAILRTYLDGKLVETVELGICEVEYKAAK